MDSSQRISNFEVFGSYLCQQRKIQECTIIQLYQKILQSMSNFCSLSVSQSLLHRECIFLLGQISHSTIIIAPSLTCLDVKITLFGVIFLNKNARKVFYCLSPQWKHMIQNNSENYSAKLQISFLTMFGSQSCDHHLKLLRWTLIGVNIFILFCFTFWSSQVRFPFQAGP